ncbi:AAC_HP2_G0013480.mRNA.1.CDS.1 [Saccharomyces cerevisiae]|nr:AAC_HP2_G0013480.mRNA.1.CDS.1 [Saccharomyces cerevisiae]CAI6453339.1 AAC_HP2_G0013480.mRNA.1.CDS.1 [Saccharomyces cerevisiae]CAI6595700.1 AAC_collapsed_G0013900.mRNA.1.CDS.1 [Saccharomyces cerevisiae]
MFQTVASTYKRTECGFFKLQIKKWTNWSIARGMVVDDKHITGLVIKPQHIRQIADSWAAIGKANEIPFALCFGVPPAAILVSSMPIPEGVSESDYVGAILGESVLVVKCETNDLMVPATSEMVFEGTLSLTDTHLEGPFGEMHGYVFKSQGHPCPLYTVKAMSYRDNAILPVLNPGLCTDETHTLIGSLVATEAKELAIESGLPILDAFMPYEAQALWLILKVDLKGLQALKTTPEEFCKKVGDIYFRTKVGFIVHEIILVADDIDIFNFKEVIWAYVTRHTPVADQMAFDDVTSFPLAPFVSQSSRSKTMKGGKCVTNCIFRQQYERSFDYITCNFEKGYPKGLVDKVNENWKRYGYK